MFNHYDTAYEDFLARIALTQGQAKRIDSSLTSLSYLFVEALEGDVEIYAQGSFATNTIVKPLTAEQSPTGEAGEYDVDIVFERNSWGDARESLMATRTVVSNDQRYAPLLQPPVKESCERIEYAPEQSGAGFHVDLVPIKHSGQRFAAFRTPDRWNPSDPTAIINWYNSLSAQNPYMTSVVTTLKRMRDVADMQKLLPSIIILAIVGNNYVNKGSYTDDLLNILEKANRLLTQNRQTLNIGIPGVPENLAHKWDDQQLAEVREYFKTTYETLGTAFQDEDLVAIRNVLSDAFPDSLYLPNLHSLRSKGWCIPFDGSLERHSITPIPEPSDLNRRQRRLLMFTKRGQRLVFNAAPYELSNDQAVYWQVLNAEGSEQIRGDYFHAKNAADKVGANDFENHEIVQYQGIHWIRYFIVNIATGVVDVASYKYRVHLNI